MYWDKVILAAVLSLSAATASAGGWYVDGQFGESLIKAHHENVDVSGYVDNHTGQILPFKDSSVQISQQEDNKSAARISFGKFLFPFLAVEVGGSYFHDVAQVDQGTIHVAGLPAGSDDTIIVSSNDSRSKFYAADLSTKVGIPWHRLFIYGSGGMALVHSQYDPLQVHLDSNSPAVGPGSDIVIQQETGHVARTTNALRPRWAAGVGVRMTKHIMADVSYSEIVGNHAVIWSNNYIPNLSMVSGSLSAIF